MNHQLLTHIKKFIKFDEARFQEVLDYFEAASFEKKEVLIRVDQKCDTVYFVVEGCLRACFVDQRGMEKTVQFALENWWITDFLAFHHQTGSNYSIQAVEPTQVLCISYDKLQDLLAKHPALEAYFRKVYEIGYGAALKRIKYIFDYSKEEIFFNFREDYPEFVNRVPQYMLATFLGLTPEYLSKLRTKKLS